MPLTPYNYSKTKFPQQEINAGQLFSEIENEQKITAILSNVIENLYDVDIIFESMLTETEQIILNNIISTHTPKILGNIEYQHKHVSIPDSDTDLTAQDLFTAILVGSPTLDRTLTMPVATNLVAYGNLQVDDSITFTIINEGTNIYTLVATTIVGNPIVVAGTSATFKIRITSMTPTETYMIYRLN